MIPTEFEYVAPTSLDGALRALADGGEEAKALAGGHSLIPLMKLRFAVPELLVDLRHIAELRGVERADGDWRIGALTRHAELQARPDMGAASEVASTIADQQVRNRGTIGGSLAHGDAASDLPALLLAAEGGVTIQGPRGSREVGASDLFVDYLTTALEPGEILTHVRLPALDGWGYAYEKFTRRAEDWAMVGVCALVQRASDGSCADVRVAFTSMATTPIRATSTEEALRGGPLDADAIGRAAALAADGTEPGGDINASPDYKRHLARVLTRRALARAAAMT
jgi:carbon-monoxide dehydrogenase medium subunit